MKFAHLIAAGLLIAGVSVSTAAVAHPHDGYSRDHRGDRDGRWDRHDDRRWDRGDRRWDRDDRRWGRHDRGHHYGWRNNRHRDCRTVWRHGERQRVCW